MAVPLSRRKPSVSTTLPDVDDNYKRLKKLINKALKEGTPLQDLHLMPMNLPQVEDMLLSRNDLLSLLQGLRRIRTNYQEILSPPVPPELVRDILAKSPEQRLPWEEEALKNAEKRKEEIESLRGRVRKELHDLLKIEFLTMDR
jgi:hypothetical protein